MKICGASRERMAKELNKMKEERENAAFLDQCVLLPYSVKESNLVSEPEKEEQEIFEKQYSYVPGYRSELLYPFTTISMAASMFLLATASMSREEFFSDKGDKFVNAGLYAVRHYSDKIRLFSQKDLEENPYINKMKFSGEKAGGLSLVMQPYDIWHICIASDFRESGYFYDHDIAVATEDILVPAVNNGKAIEERVCMSEILLTKEAVERAHGKVLAMDITSLQYFAYMAHLKDDVESVTIYLNDGEHKKLFSDYILPKFDYPEKIKIAGDENCPKDEIEYETFDFCFARIWDEFYTNLKGYIATLQLFDMLKNTECCCYMENALLEHIKNVVVLDTLFHTDMEINFGVQASDSDIDYISELFSKINITTPEGLKDIMRAGKIKEFLKQEDAE